MGGTQQGRGTTGKRFDSKLRKRKTLKDTWIKESNRKKKRNGANSEYVEKKKRVAERKRSGTVGGRVPKGSSA